MQWWEKTVEYYFVQKYVPLDSVLSALDGKHEKIGDTLLGHQERWIIIEFKKDYPAIKSEEDKFVDYEAAYDELHEIDGHHYLIYGAINEDLEFTLCGRTYFSDLDAVDIDHVLESGVEQTDFNLYIEKLLKHKNDDSSGGSGSGITPQDYAFVAGVNKNNEITKCMSLQEYGLEYGLNLKPLLRMSRGYSRRRDLGGPSRS
ncbi:hypothetical protein KW471_06500 [Vibrio fluvialis]|nr:hypothetical protein [Vibrio fluvialis]